MLVLDQSNSMNFDAGDGRARIDVLKDAAPVFVDLLGDDDAVGVVRFDDDAHPGTPIAVAGPLPFGAGRTAAKAAISSHTPTQRAIRRSVTASRWPMPTSACRPWPASTGGRSWC